MGTYKSSNNQANVVDVLSITQSLTTKSYLLEEKEQ